MWGTDCVPAAAGVAVLPGVIWSFWAIWMFLLCLCSDHTVSTQTEFRDQYIHLVWLLLTWSELGSLPSSYLALIIALYPLNLCHVLHPAHGLLNLMADPLACRAGAFKLLLLRTETF